MKILLFILVLISVTSGCNEGDGLPHQSLPNNGNGICEVGEIGSDCDGICLITEEGSIDCTEGNNNGNGICEIGETGSDCNGMCEPSEEGSLDCSDEGNNGNGICELGEVGSDCDGLCLEPSETESIDCGDNGHRLKFISIMPSVASLPLNSTLNMITTGYFNGGRASNISRYVDWRTDALDVVSIVVPNSKAQNFAIATGLTVNTANITASIGDAADIASLIVTNETINLSTINVIASETLIPIGFPSQMDMTVSYTDGTFFTTENNEGDERFVSWTISPDVGAKIDEEGQLDTSGMAAASMLTITGTGTDALNGASDTVMVMVTDAVLVPGSGLVSIEGNSADGQGFPAGIPVQLEASVNFSDDINYSTANSIHDAIFMRWSIAGNTGATISSEGLLNTFDVEEGAVLTITATGISPGAYAGESDSITVVVTDSIAISGSGIVTISNRSTDGQRFPVGIPVQLEMRTNFSNGASFSTMDSAYDASFMRWTISGNTGASITTEGRLNTQRVAIGTSLGITGTGSSFGPWAGESDSITVVVTDATVLSGSGIVTINNNSADYQSFPAGIPVQLEAAVNFSDGATHSTEELDDDVSIMNWRIAGSTGASITTEGLLNTAGVTPHTTLTITATGKKPGVYAGESDSIIVVVNDAIVESGSGVVLIDNNSADGQSFPVGIPVQLEIAGKFSDGLIHSTEESNDDVRIISWSIAGNTGATISTEGRLNTTGVAPGTTLTITATGKPPGAYAGESDSITLIVTDAILLSGSEVVSIEGNSVDGQSFPAGIPVQLEAAVSFSDGVTHSTNDSIDDASLISWTITGNTGASITTEGLLNTEVVVPNTTLIITATGKTPGPYAGESDSITVVITDAIVVLGSGLVTINNNSADGQSFPVGISIQLDMAVSFSDGVTHSTEELDDDVSFMSWTIAGNTGASITTEGLLNTAGVAPDTTLTVTAMGKTPGPYAGESDSIIVVVSDAIVVSGSGLVTINNNSLDGQSFPAGIPVQLEARVSFSDGTTHSTEEIDDDVSIMDWSISGNTGATISSGGVLNTLLVAPNSMLTITATAKRTGPYAGESDSIIVIVSDGVFTSGSAMVVINGNGEDGQFLPVGIPVQLEVAVSFSDGTTHSTEELDDDVSIMSWRIAGNTSASITTEGLLSTIGVAQDTTLTITATGNTPGPYAGERDSITVVLSDAILTKGSGVVTINNNSADGQSFPAGIPVQLEAAVSFSDGLTYSTEEIDDDVSIMSWSIKGNTGATITTEGKLNTAGVVPDTSLIITATGKNSGAYAGESDSITLVVTDATLVSGSEVVTINNNPANGQSFSTGSQVQLEAAVSFSNGSTGSTKESNDDVSFMSWTIAGNTSASITPEGLLNTSGVVSGTNLVITATGKASGPWDGESDSITIKIIDVAVPPATDITWNTSATKYRGQNGKIIRFQCPPNGSKTSIWGTSVYTDDSRVCTAGVHMGVITFTGGGLVTIKISAGISSYTKSTRNGVTSNSYGSWAGSFSVQ